VNIPHEATRNGSAQHHRGPHLGALAMVYTVLFLAGLYPVITFTGGAHFPGPWESGDAIASYFQAHPTPVLICAFLQFGAAVPLGIYTAAIVSRLRFLGNRAAGPYIALFGGLATVFDMMACAHVLWVMVRPGIAQDTVVLRALYYLSFSLGGPGFSVPMGLLMAGVSVSVGFRKLLPKWVVGLGLLLAACGELSWISMIVPNAVFLIPLTRFPGFIWLIAAGFMLPATVTSRVGQPGIAEG
jgi:hypothetical protein